MTATIQQRTFARRPVARCEFESACSDCGHQETHATGPEASRAAVWHELTNPGHRGLIATWLGWHRPRREWV